MTFLYGKPVADKILLETKARIEATGITPGFAVILVGDDASSHLYVGLKEKTAGDIGVHFEKYIFDTSVSQDDILACIGRLNEQRDIHGIIVQLPLPAGYDTDSIIAHIDPKKDADGFHQETVQQFLAGKSEACPVFPLAMVELLRSSQAYQKGERGYVVANSPLMGRVMTQALLLEGLPSEYVLYTDSTETISERLRDARVIITAVGVAHCITGSMISPGAIIIDGGISHLDGKVVGDVESKSVAEKAGWLSPVPGGVGPLTIACLLKRTLFLAENSANR